MLNTQKFGEILKGFGFDFFSGVPCSLLQNLINYAINDCQYIAAANEGDAVSIASGAFLGGKKAVVLMQNSGLTNATSPLVSLNQPFQIPVLGFVSWRGEPHQKDEPQHELMGKLTTKWLSDMQIEWTVLENDLELAKEQLKKANEIFNQNKSFFFVVRKNTFENVELNVQSVKNYQNKTKIKNFQVKSNLPSRWEVLKNLVKIKSKNTFFLATTGKTGRELFEISDSENNFYQVGSMGCVSSIGLGLALAKPDKKIVVIDGDGSVLMRMGALATLANYRPKNLLHILLDNNAHDSTGGQKTVSNQIDFIEVLAGFSYPNVIEIKDLEDFEKRLKTWKLAPELTFLYFKIKPGSKKNLARPNLKPHQVKERMMNLLML